MQHEAMGTTLQPSMGEAALGVKLASVPIVCVCVVRTAIGAIPSALGIEARRVTEAVVLPLGLAIGVTVQRA